MKYDLVIFDMDGVLVDACEWHRVALNKALKHVSGYEISLDDHITEYNGIPTKVKLQKLVSKNIIKQVDVQKIEDLKQDFTIDIIQSTAQLRQEKVDLFKYLKTKNIKSACYTNSIRKTAELMLQKTGILSMLDLLVTNQDVKNPKPDPEGYNLIVDFFKFDKNRVIIVEDSPKGLEAAYASGCNVLKVRDQDEVTADLIKKHE